ncbi:MAG: phenylalanine--tRNA ligase subunit beta [Betaproteobacteria bacterium]|nr:phenylalanine--tRNA ligase subunit beta [Betaproteobacteria bacterium]
MQFSEHWLRTWVNPPLDSDQLAHALTMAGLEVEDSAAVAPPCSGVVVAQVLEVARHPNADRLSVCKVDAGTGAMLDIVCGAPNVAPGIKVPCALVGARLPPAEAGQGPFEIRRATMRGVDSAGMLCSARELHLSDDHSGLLVLPADAPVGADIRRVLALDDRLLTLKLTPNKADCLSILGVAREVAALTGAPLTAPAIPPVAPVSDATFPVTITAPEGCGRFTGRVIRNVNAHAPTPGWMKDRLARSGQRSISALVDVTNYVMLELGRPLHVYDLAKLQGKIDVRYGRPGERVKLLNEQTVPVHYTDLPVLCITDDSGPIGLAGIMGGDSTKAETDSTAIFLESAFFHPNAIAGRARRYNFVSDASHRFERGVDFDNNVAGIERATRLILDICGGEPGPVVDTVARLPVRAPVRLRVARTARVLGITVPPAEIAGIFTRLQLPFTRGGDGPDADFIVAPPSHRFDLEIEEDLIEEVARIHGFENIPAHPPVAPSVMLPTHETQRSIHAVRHLVADLDYQEVVNFSFVDTQAEIDFAANAEPIRLLNPIASQMSVMRSSLLSGLVGNIAYNVKRRAPRVRVFEVGKVYLRDKAAPDGPLAIAGYRQPLRIAGAAYGPAVDEQWGTPKRQADFYDVKADVEALLGGATARFVPASHPALHPGRSARIERDGAAIGWLGELHPRLARAHELPAAPVLFEIEWAALQHVGLPDVRPVSRFPPVRRDLAVVVAEEVPTQALVDAMLAVKPACVADIRVFDVYRGGTLPQGQKSLAFLVLMQDTQRTLTDPEVDAAMEQLFETLRDNFNGTTR